MEDIKRYNIDNLGGHIIDQWGTYKRNKRDIVKKIKYNNKIYKMIRNLDGFYNKALIYQNVKNSSNYILLSYETIVAEYNGEYMTIYGYYSQTTTKHINAFLERFGFKGMSKSEMLQNINKKIYFNN